jgi:hypothetical protein
LDIALVFSTEKGEAWSLGIDDGFAKESVAEKGEGEEDPMVAKSVKGSNISSQYLLKKKVKENNLSTNFSAMMASTVDAALAMAYYIAQKWHSLS